MIINEKQTRKVIPLAAAKGGVGVTTLAANLALELAANEKETVLVDLDLGGSNLHTALGVKNTNRGIGNFLASREVDFESIIVPTPYERLRLIPGDVLVPGLDRSDPARVNELYGALAALEADYLLLDAGSGCGGNLEPFLVSNSGLVVMNSRKTSVLNTYRFFKNLAYRLLAGALAERRNALELLERTFKGKDPDSFTKMSDLLRELEDLDTSAAGEARKQLATLQPKLILNDARTPDELDTA
ncbi:MAG: AAA family ATPase, partial [Spirochaetota bacterium]